MHFWWVYSPCMTRERDRYASFIWEYPVITKDLTKSTQQLIHCDLLFFMVGYFSWMESKRFHYSMQHVFFLNCFVSVYFTPICSKTSTNCRWYCCSSHGTELDQFSVLRKQFDDFSSQEVHVIFQVFPNRKCGLWGFHHLFLHHLVLHF